MRPFHHTAHGSDTFGLLRSKNLVSIPRVNSQVNVFESGLCEARFDRRLGLFIANCPRRDLGGEENFTSWDSGFLDCLGARAFIAICSRGVYLK